MVGQGAATVSIFGKELHPSFVEGQGVSEVADVPHARSGSRKALASKYTNRRYCIPLTRVRDARIETGG